MEISKIKLALKWLFGGTESALDYIIDAANNAIGSLGDATKEKIVSFNNGAQRVLVWLKWGKKFCPSKWDTFYQDVVTAFENVTNACADLEITKDEIVTVAISFKTAYADWRTE